MTTIWLLSLSSCDGPAPAAPPKVTVAESRAPAPGLLYTLEVKGSVPDDAEGLQIFADCGGTGVFEEVPGAVLSSEEPSVTLALEAEGGPAASAEEAEKALEASLSEQDVVYDEIFALLEMVPIPECEMMPECSAELMGYFEELAPIQDDAVGAAADMAAAWSSPLHGVEVTACSFEVLDLDGKLFQETPRIKPQPVEDFVQGYEDWTKKVQIKGDPCEGKTPVECYRDKIETWKKRACGEIDAKGQPVSSPPPVDDLPQPFQDICRAIKNYWVTFPDTSCEHLKAAGETERLPVPQTPDDVPAGMHAEGTGSSVAIDWKALLQSTCSYGTFIHEMTHVVDNGSRPTPNLEVRKQMEAAIAQIKMLVVMRNLALAMFQLYDALVLSNLISDQVQALLTAAGKGSLQDELDARLSAECNAYLGVMHLGTQLTEPAPDGATADQKKKLEEAQTKWLKEGPETMLMGIHGVLGGFSTAAPSEPARAATCKCLQDMHDWATATTAAGDSQSVWECVKKHIILEKDPATDGFTATWVDERYADLRKRLGCDQ